MRPYSQPLRGSCTRTVTVSPRANGSSFGLDEEGCDTRALMALPPPRPRDSPTELERERLGRGDGAARRVREAESTSNYWQCTVVVVLNFVQIQLESTLTSFHKLDLSPLEGTLPNACCSLLAHDMSSSLATVCSRELTEPRSCSDKIYRRRLTKVNISRSGR